MTEAGGALRHRSARGPEPGPAEGEETAPAKLNLYLRVTGRRPDGYHLLDSLAVFTEAGDHLRAERQGGGLRLELSGPFGTSLAAEPDNLVLRAARALASEAAIKPDARLRLEKRLPVASGIGGGSADAAAALRLLKRLWRVAIEPERLAALALGLGADVPVCLASEARRMGGVGERLTPAPALPALGILLVNPGVAVSTAEVFRARAPGFSAPANLPERWADLDKLAADLRTLGNDLQAPGLRLCPPIGHALAAIAALPGCRLAAMSGSGATCFGLFPTPTAAAEAASRLRGPGWWVWGGGLFARASGGPGSASPSVLGPMAHR